ncbi:hypothetical protein CERSUDRAFT_110250 [Lichtheimia corymbifera JMRC:FSU:9682]|uniref:RRM domain-containing protein n=1 Tax=Lichtheimia corymbifera JMRC:FSU:9682 TaxID=1263082 RepID=A0A068RMA3_9FUNG|nr:hypothetical protein CERSUDRAFT_110250 [Lichtheimia corymbifera JMRC:FSU:9682]
MRAHNNMSYSHQDCKTLRFNNLDPRVDDRMLHSILSTVVPVDHVHMAEESDERWSALDHHAYVRFHDHHAAEQAFHVMDGRTLFGKVVEATWNEPKKKSSSDQSTYGVVMKNLSPDVSTESIRESLTPYKKQLSQIEFIWDNATGKTKGMARVNFLDEKSAHGAAESLNNTQLGKNTIQCAPLSSSSSSLSSENTRAGSHEQNVEAQQSPSLAPASSSNKQSYDDIFNGAPLPVTTVYVHPLPSETTKQDLWFYFSQYGYVSGIDLHLNESYAIVSMDTHANAALAMFSLQEFKLHDEPVQLDWSTSETAKPYQISNSPPTSSFASAAPVASTSSHPSAVLNDTNSSKSPLFPLLRTATSTSHRHDAQGLEVMESSVYHIQPQWPSSVTDQYYYHPASSNTT